MAETEFEGAKVVLALTCDATRDRMAEALVGCCFYLNDPDALEHIVACDGPEGPWRVETPKGPRALIRDRLAQGYVIERSEPSRLRPLIEEAKHPSVKEAEAAKAWLREREVSPPKLANDDAVGLSNALQPDERRLPSSYDARSRVADILFRYGSERFYIRLAEAWLQQRTPGSADYPHDVVIRLVSAYRGLGDCSSAREWVERVTRPEVARNVSRNQLAILFTQRAAVCLDFYERDGNDVWLKDARRFAGRSWAICRSPECGLVINRLEKLEKELRDRR